MLSIYPLNSFQICLLEEEKSSFSFPFLTYFTFYHFILFFLYFLGICVLDVYIVRGGKIMNISFTLEAFADYCAEIRIHPVLSQFEEQLLDLILM
jgi:hypothetical protein